MRIRAFSFAALLLALLEIGASGGCSKKDEEVTLEGLPYVFPRAHVLDIVHKGQGMPFVRLKPPDENFLLVKDSMADLQQKKSGKTIVSKINSSRFAEVEELRQGDTQVFCRDSPRFQCGIKVDDQGILWSVIFSRGFIRNTPEMKNRAVEVLSGYRKEHNRITSHEQDL